MKTELDEASEPTVPKQTPSLFRDLFSVPKSTALDSITRELQAESITVRIRGFGLCVGYLYVNLVIRETGRAELNAMLTLGAVYALMDTVASLRGRILLAEYRIGISVMEALFIGLLCFFDRGLTSPFRFYYFLSLIVCAIRHSPALTFATFGLHTVSYIVLGLYAPNRFPDEGETVLLTLVFLGWTVWAIIALTGLLKAAGRRMARLNAELREDQQHLEQRIARRTKELQESQAMLVQQEKQAAFGLLAAGIAHEVGNPLASISSIVQMLGRRNPDDYMRERLQMVDGQLTRIQKTLRELIGFSRPTNQQVSSVDVHAAINDALNIAKYYKRWKGKVVETQFGADIPLIRTVYDQLVQVLLNLILNALDATEEGATITISTSVDPPADPSVPEDTAGGEISHAEVIRSDPPRDESLLPASRFVSIQVRDEGHGISETAQQQIFQPYFTTKETGTGLGLFVCRQLVRQTLSGEIRLLKSSSHGTTFEVSLPVQL